MTKTMIQFDNGMVIDFPVPLTEEPDILEAQKSFDLLVDYVAAVIQTPPPSPEQPRLFPAEVDY